MKVAEFAISVDTDEAAHYELPQLDLCCLLSIIWKLNIWNSLD